MHLSWRQDSCCLHRTCTHEKIKKQYKFALSISFPSSILVRFLFVWPWSLIDFPYIFYLCSLFILSLKISSWISGFQFLQQYSLTHFDVFVGHRHTAFTRQQTSKPVTFGSQTCLRHFYWFEGVTEIEWQMLSQHWSHIPMWERTASVAFICCYLDKSWIGGYLRSTVPKTTPQKTVLGWQWRKQPKFVGSLSSDLWF